MASMDSNADSYLVNLEGVTLVELEQYGYGVVAAVVVRARDADEDDADLAAPFQSQL